MPDMDAFRLDDVLTLDDNLRVLSMRLKSMSLKIDFSLAENFASEKLEPDRHSQTGNILSRNHHQLILGSTKMANARQIYPRVDVEVICACQSFCTVRETDVKQTTTGLLFAVAIITASARTAIRIKFHRRLFADDAFLFIACLALTALFATVLYYTSTTYTATAILSGQLREGSTVSPASVDLGAVVSGYRKVQYLRASLAWLTIFAVKFSFLCFFRPLTDRLPRLLLYWRVVVATNILAFVYCVACNFLGCLGSSDDTCEWWCRSQRLSDNID